MDKKAQKVLKEYVRARGLAEGSWETMAQAGGTEADLIERVIASGIATERDILTLFADSFHLPVVDLRSIAIAPQVTERIPVRIAMYYTFVPLEIKERVLVIAVSVPLDVQVQDEIRTHTGFSIETRLALQHDILETLKRAYGVGADTVERIASGNAKIVRPQASSDVRLETIDEHAQDASVIKLVNEIIFEAYKKRATDIHIEPYRDDLAIRYRIDGVLYDMKVSSEIKNYFLPIISRIKIMSNLDIVERRLPQDGRAMVKTQEQTLDLRVSTLPPPYGESGVIRILPTKILYSLQKLGLSTDHLTILESLIETPHGIIFVTGPTGSGKTTTLYACLSKINTRDRKIITLEDPVEYEMQGMTQIQVHPEIGLDFARGLRSILRHDPDIIMVGEVRDLETAEIAIRVALTGHLIFSTLHTNDAASGVTRLIDIGIEPYLIASSVVALIAQRLVRVLCPGCRIEDTEYPKPMKENIAKELGISVEEVKVFKARGCERCGATGFFGRTAIYEMLLVDDQIKQLITQRLPSNEIKRAAQAHGMRTLLEDGLHKIIKGVTTPEEVFKAVSFEGSILEEKNTASSEPQAIAEKRVYQRLDSQVNVRYQVRAQGTQAFASKTGVGFERFSISKNISAGGIACTVVEQLAPGTILDLQIDVPDGMDPVKCLGKVMRVKELGNSAYEAGICFLDLTGGERARLERFIIQESAE